MVSVGMSTNEIMSYIGFGIVCVALLIWWINVWYDNRGDKDE